MGVLRGPADRRHPRLPGGGVLSEPGAAQAPGPRLARLFRRHLVVFLVVNIALTAINVYGGAPWWAFWPLAIWGLALMLHFLYYRATSVDDAWVDERTLDLHSKSYDAGHIDDIRKHPAPSVEDEMRKGGKR